MFAIRSLTLVLVMTCVSGFASAQGLKTEKYPFRVSPLALFAQMEKIEGIKVTPFSKEDAALLEKLWKHNSEKNAKAPDSPKELATLFMIASGVPEKDRDAYMKKLDKLEREARAALIVHKNDRDLAEKLLVYLHKGVMCKGYRLNESTLQSVFEKNEFNCVSSSAVYYLIGARFGLKMQPIIIDGKPGKVGHVTVDYLDGKNKIRMETTTSTGFNYDAKRKAAIDAGHKLSDDELNRSEAHESDGFGIASSIASNLTQTNSKSTAEEIATALRFGVISLVLDPQGSNSIGNFKAAVVNCGYHLIEKKDYENAVNYHKVMQEYLGKIDLLEKNHLYAWERYLLEVYESEKVEEGAKLLKQASEAFPNHKSFENANHWIIMAAQNAKNKSGWKAAIELIDRASKDIPLAEMKDLNKWKSTARRMWSQDLLKAEDVQGAFEVIRDGLKDSPNDADLLAGLRYFAFQALPILERKGDLTKTADEFKKWKKEFPKDKGINDAGYAFAYDSIKSLFDSKNYAEAIKRCQDYREFVGDRIDDLKGDAFNRLGNKMLDEKRWEDAFNHYKEAIKECPNHRGLTQNALYALDQWAKESMNKKDWDEAIKIYEMGLKSFPNESVFKQNIRYCEQEKKR